MDTIPTLSNLEFTINASICSVSAYSQVDKSSVGWKWKWKWLHKYKHEFGNKKDQVINISSNHPSGSNFNCKINILKLNILVSSLKHCMLYVKPAHWVTLECSSNTESWSCVSTLKACRSWGRLLAALCPQHLAYSPSKNTLHQ